MKASSRTTYKKNLTQRRKERKGKAEKEIYSALLVFVFLCALCAFA
jgi:hypothetical protein